jgi:SAM-dependent methyltransferase
MSALPDSRGSYERFWRILMGSLTARLMMEAVEMGLFDLLNEFRGAAEVAARLDTHADNTRRFLDALVTVDLLEKSGGLYRNLPATRAFLVRGEPGYVGGLLRFAQGMCIDPLCQLPALVRQGPAAPDQAGPAVADEALWAEAARSGAAWVLGEMGRTMATVVSRLDGFSGFERMLDLGGGHGAFTLYFVDAHPSMKGVVFDRSAITPVAAEFIRQYGMAERISVAEGDYLTDDIGSGYDLVWASSTLNFARFNLDPLMAKIYAALRPGGYFLSFQDGLTYEHTKPDVMLGFLSASLQTGLDYGFEQGSIAEAMLRCGFRSVRSRTFDTPMGQMDLDIARK